MSKNKTKIRYAVDKSLNVDFGRLPDFSAQGEIEVDSKLWERYVYARAEYEKLNADLLRCLPKSLYKEISAENYEKVQEILKTTTNFLRSMLPKSKVTEILKELETNIASSLYDCSGCTDPKSEGTHQGFSKQHFKEIYFNKFYKEVEEY